jgi:endoglucanase
MPRLQALSFASPRTPARFPWAGALSSLALSMALSACADAGTSPLGSDHTETAPSSIPSSSANTPSPLVGASFYVDPSSPARKQADAWRASRPADAAQLDKIAGKPLAMWLGDWMGTEPYAEVARLTAKVNATGAIPVFVVYNIPLRDCGLWSAGGAASPAAYTRWVSEVARGIGSSRAVVIVEPDAVAGMDCLAAADQKVRLELIREAVRTLKASPKVTVYVDAGNAGWHPPVKMAPRLRDAGIETADGFALNVSNFFDNAQSIRYGAELSGLVGSKHFVIDTSRNGSGPSTPYEWCNPLGRSLGVAPTANTGHPLVDAYLWVKPPGESDGECNGGPGAGKWWAEYAVGLAQRSA